jgi:hypothetical protein
MKHWLLKSQNRVFIANGLPRNVIKVKIIKGKLCQSYKFKIKFMNQPKLWQSSELKDHGLPRLGVNLFCQGFCAMGQKN